MAKTSINNLKENSLLFGYQDLILECLYSNKFCELSIERKKALVSFLINEISAIYDLNTSISDNNIENEIVKATLQNIINDMITYISKSIVEITERIELLECIKDQLPWCEDILALQKPLEIIDSNEPIQKIKQVS